MNVEHIISEQASHDYTDILMRNFTGLEVLSGGIGGIGTIQSVGEGLFKRNV